MELSPSSSLTGQKTRCTEVCRKMLHHPPPSTFTPCEVSAALSKPLAITRHTTKDSRTLPGGAQ